MPSLDPPVPTAAGFNPGFKQTTVTFSHAIRFNAVNDPTNWFVRWNALRWPVTGASVGPAVVTLTSSSGTPDAGSDVVSYSPPPFDVVSDTARPTPAPAFADFPVT